MLFYTSSAFHLSSASSITANAEIKKFQDGEIRVRLLEDVKGRLVTVIAATHAPAEHIWELYLLLDALQVAGATITLYITYLGYARQYRSHERESRGLFLFERMLSRFNLHALHILHMHNAVESSLPIVTHHIPYEFFVACAQDADCIVAPDRGAYTFAAEVARRAEKQLVVLRKKRVHDDAVTLELVDGDLGGKRVLIVDDMISTAATLCGAAQLLYDAGAADIRAAATHGIFAADAGKRIDMSKISHVWVTNSIAQTQRSIKIEVVDITQYMQTQFLHAHTSIIAPVKVEPVP